MDATVRVTDEPGNEVHEHTVEDFERVVVEPWATTDDDGVEISSAPLAWLNHASVYASEEEDSVTVMISVGDPRGAFEFSVRRIPADADSELAGKLIMHVPYPEKATPHVPVRDLHPGTYLIEGV